MDVPNALREHEALLLALCARRPASLSPRSLERLARRDFRRALHELAGRLRVTGLALVALERSPEARKLPADAVAELLAPLARLRERAARQDRELARLVAKLRERDIDPVALKGPALRRTVYREPVERWFGDLDLLVPPERFEAAVEAALDAGYRAPYSAEAFEAYRRHHFHVLLRHPDRFVIEIHWALEPQGSPFRLEASGVLERARAVDGQGLASLRVPCLEDLLLHAACESRRDWFARLHRVADVDRILAAGNGFDWDAVCARARAGGLESILWLTLELTRSLLDTDVPREVRAALRPGPVAFAHLALLRPADALFQPERPGRRYAVRLLRLWLVAGADRRLRHFLRMLAGDEEPLDWVWQKRERPPHRLRALAFRLRLTAGVALYQLWLYARRAAGRR